MMFLRTLVQQRLATVDTAIVAGLCGNSRRSGQKSDDAKELHFRTGRVYAKDWCLWIEGEKMRYWISILR